SVVTAFVSAASLFGAMSIIGMTTKADLTKFGTYLLMGLIGLFLAMIINLFLASSTMDYIISVIGVIIFLGLTAYDTQKINAMASAPGLQRSQEMALRVSVIGALVLYLDFLNLFIFLLRLTGSRR
ncbi:MAG: Bax inhibitor-1/YccA family protein, partial [Anaerolineae bacterium]|nr:Bax inhibitor-1/YccA family protein [Anaerolineae bacterium]